MDYLLLAISCFSNSAKSIFGKVGTKYLNRSHNIYAFNFYSFVIAFLIALPFAVSGVASAHFATYLMAVFFGLTMVFGQIFLIKAMNAGDVSVSMLFYSCGFLIPTFVSTFVYNEPLSVLQIIGVVLIVASFIISAEKTGKGSVKWFIFAIVSFLFNGCISLSQKIFRMSDFGSEQSVFAAVAFLIGAVAAFVIMPKTKALPTKGFALTGVGSGIMLGVVNVINVHVSGVLPGIIVFPTVNGGSIIVSAILARILLGEKISLRKKIGIAVGVAAICLIAL